MRSRIGKYEEEVLCDVVPMLASHLLLGRPWQFDRRAKHDGFTNKYLFEFRQRNVTLVPMTPRQVYEDQVRLQQESEKEIEIERKKGENEKEKREKTRMSEKEKQNEKESENSSEARKEDKKSLIARASEVKRALFSKQPMIVLLYKEALNINILDTSLPSAVVSLLLDYEDVFPEDVPQGLPPIRGIEHQIDFVPGASIPN